MKRERSQPVARKVKGYFVRPPSRTEETLVKRDMSRNIQGLQVCEAAQDIYLI